MKSRLMLAIVAATALNAMLASPALAECMTWPLPATERPVVAFAFSGTVVDVSARDDPDQGGSTLFFRRAAVDVDRVYRGRMSDTVELFGNDWGCSFFYVSTLAVGDRIFVASERLGPAPYGETDFGNVLVWVGTNDGGWRFHEAGLQDGSDREFYSPAARTAKTTKDIVHLISGLAMPDTSTAVTDPPAAPPHVLLVAVFAASLGLFVTGSAHRRRCRPASSSVVHREV